MRAGTTPTSPTVRTAAAGCRRPRKGAGNTRVTTPAPGSRSFTWGAGGSSRVDTHYIFANGRAVAQWTTSNVESDLLQYLHRDHQGNVVATTDDAGDLVAEYEYDPFRVRTVISGSGQDSLRGYTGHEHLAPVELIHMNGRVQDPVLGRFLSADPFVQAPYASRSLNRYSYVWNNPMTLVDPSGYQAEA